MPTPAAADEQVPDLRDAAGATLDGLDAITWDTLGGVGLVEAAAVLAQVRVRVDAALVEVAGRLADPSHTAAREALGRAGWASAKDFLTHLLGGRKGTGGGLVKAADLTAALPEVRAAMLTGVISTAQARVIGEKVATLPRLPELRDEVTARMLDQAVGGLDATDLDHGFTQLLEDVDPDGAARGHEADKAKAERAAHHARGLWFTDDTVGGCRIGGYTTLEDAETIRNTLAPLAAPQTTEPGACGGQAHDPSKPHRAPGDPTRPSCPDPRCHHDGQDPRTPEARLHDALLEGCRRLQNTDDLPHAHGTTARINVTISHHWLLDQTGHGVLGDGQSISIAAVRRLACDAEILPAVLGAHGEVLDVGHVKRLVTTAIWLALVLRDRHCSFPGCSRPPIACEAHHLRHWADGGPTSLDNLALLCRRHHTIAHTTPWTVHLDPVTRRPVWTPPPPDDDTGRWSIHRPRPPTRPPRAPRPPRRPPGRAA